MTQDIRSVPLKKLHGEDFPSCRTVLLVTGRASYEACGASREIERIFAGCEIVRFSDFETNPRLEDLQKGLPLCRKADLIVAVGGGSVLDMAKLLKAFAACDGNPEDFVTGRKKLESLSSLPLIAVPTTSGSGSESTHFAVVYVNKIKYSLAHPELLPSIVVLDPSLTLSMSAQQAAVSGLDALSQAVESWWSVNANPESRNFAEKSMALTLEHLIPSVQSGSLKNREGMQRAANLAGQAINISKTTGAHAFSYYLTSRFGIPHGYAAALMLIPFILYNSRGGRLEGLFPLLQAENAEEAAEKVSTIIRSCALEPRLAQLIDVDAVFEDFLASVNLERLQNNPRPLDNPEEFRALLLR
ncbi:MAG: phosphonoacetaldehyde reductase [Spirochaetales bacterium]|nr:phosphonoacetaldehyde reductase [Spirochaetales bacterium]